jgi:hypothetical protein
MKKILALITAFLSGIAKADGPQLGSERDVIRQLLFASQSLREQVKNIHLDGSPGAFQSIVDAARLAEDGKKTDAIAVLRKVLETPKLETRIQLWVWSALRELGQQPDPKSAYEVLGAIIEMPSGDGYDTLAAYADGSARYLNFSGAAIFWDAEDLAVKAMCQQLVDSTIPASNRAKPRVSLSLPRGVAQVTMLTRSGPFVIVSPPESVIGAGATLMLELMKRSEEAKKKPTDEHGSSALNHKPTTVDPKKLRFSQLDITERFGDQNRLTKEEWISTVALNSQMPDPESRGLPARSASADEIYSIGSKLSAIREQFVGSGEGVYCLVCHVANIDHAKLHTPCPKCGRKLLSFGWD